MWYEGSGENSKFVRAPTPQALDQRIQNLENRDSILFNSIALPTAKPRSDPPKEPESQPIIRESADHSENSTVEVTSSISLGDDFDDFSDTDKPKQSDLGQLLESLRIRVAQLENEGSEKDREIAEKDKEIDELKSELLEVQDGNLGSQADDPSSYKSLYESTRDQLDKLKEALKAEGKVKKVRINSVRVIGNPK